MAFGALTRRSLARSLDLYERKRNKQALDCPIHLSVMDD